MLNPRNIPAPTQVASAPSISQFKFIDIGVNLTDPVFRGKYRGKRKHDDDFQAVLERATAAGVKSMIITGTSLEESKLALKMASENGLYCTVGCHPTRSTEFEKYKGGPKAYLNALDELIGSQSACVAIGECGLDYDRTHFASTECQKTHFRSQLSLAKKHRLPLFLHSRAAHSDFVKILREEGFGKGGDNTGECGGVVHSFTGSEQELKELIDMGFYISVNGCSLKTEGNLNAARSIPLDRMMLETDAPWCSMTGGHASKKLLDSLPALLKTTFFPPSCKPESFSHGKVVKGRNEPCAIGGVAWIMSALHGVEIIDLTTKVYNNTLELFNIRPE